MLQSLGLTKKKILQSLKNTYYQIKPKDNYISANTKNAIFELNIKKEKRISFSENNNRTYYNRNILYNILIDGENKQTKHIIKHN